MKVQKVSDVEWKVEGEFGLQDIEEEYRKVLEEIRQEVEIPGFRKGKAPLHIVEGRFGDRAKNDAIGKKIFEVLKGRSEWLMPVNIKELVWNETNGKISFSVKVEVIPRKKIDTRVKVDVKPEELKVTEEEIKNQIERLKERYSTLVPTDEKKVVQGKNLAVLCDITLRNLAGKVVRRMPSQYVDFDRAPDWLKKTLEGLGVGETKESVANIEGDTLKVQVKVKDIKQKKVPDDEELAKTAGYESFAAMREKIAKELEEAKKQAIRNIKFADAIAKIVQKNKLSAPPTLIAQEYSQITRRNPSMLSSDAERLATLNALEKVVLLNFAEDRGIKVTEEDFENFVSEFAKENRIPPARAKQMLSEIRETVEEQIKLRKAREELAKEIFKDL